MVTLQGSLFDLGQEEGPRPLGSALERTILSQGAWVDVQRGWVTGAGPLFDRLLQRVPWRAERRRMYDRIVDVPRLLAFYATGYPLPDPVLDQLKRALVQHYGQGPEGPFSTAGLCLYRDGRDGVAWHGDTIGRGATHDTMVAIVSLGAPRRLLLRPRVGGSTLRCELAAGDLLVMGGSCQRTWEHALPKTARPVGPRISVQFRARGVR
ncbi:MAG: alpha-ketoglutarate-dependent dioxygenase AlkB [Acidimicrobiales bacterium]